MKTLKVFSFTLSICLSCFATSAAESSACSVAVADPETHEPTQSTPQLLPRERYDYDFGSAGCVAGFGSCSARSIHLEPKILSGTLNVIPGHQPLAQLALIRSAVQSGPVCRRISLNPPPEIVRGAVWLEERSELLVLSSHNSGVLYSLAGDETAGLDGLKEALGGLSWSGLKQFRDGYMLKLGAVEVAILDKWLRVKNRLSLEQRCSAGGSVLKSLYGSWVVKRDVIVGYGALKDEQTGSMHFGIVRLVLSQDAACVNELELLSDTPNKYYLLGHDYAAANERDVFYIDMGQRAELYRIPNGTGRPVVLRALPAEVRSPPQLVSSTNRASDMRSLFAEIERHAVPVGVYGLGEHAVILTRWPSTEGGTEWRLYFIDPSKDTLIGWSRIPTRTNHITVVPAGTSWVVIERGELISVERQPVLGVMVITINELVATAAISADRFARIHGCG